MISFKNQEAMPSKGSEKEKITDYEKMFQFHVCPEYKMLPQFHNKKTGNQK